jgi:hypothetical protein
MPRARSAVEYETNVFINCPFDLDYQAIFHAIVFAVIHCGYTVRCALETEDTGPTRIQKILDLIEACHFGIHDISRIERDAVNDLPRFNMPFELGLFLGARRFGTGDQRRKRCLVLEAERYRYQKFLSDIAGQDIRQHNNEQGKAVGAVRDWLAASRPKAAPPLPGAAAIMKHYGEFETNLPAILKAADIEPAELGFFDRANFMDQFLQRRAALTSSDPLRPGRFD